MPKDHDHVPGSEMDAYALRCFYVAAQGYYWHANKGWDGKFANNARMMPDHGIYKFWFGVCQHKDSERWVAGRGGRGEAERVREEQDQPRTHQRNATTSNLLRINTCPTINELRLTLSPSNLNHRRVTELHLQSNNIHGPLIDTLSWLDHIRNLQLPKK